MMFPRGIALILPEITAGDHEVGLCGPEDVVDGPGGQHLPHGLIDHLLVVATANRHGAQEANSEYLLQEGVCRDAKTITQPLNCVSSKNTEPQEYPWRELRYTNTHKRG